MVLSNPGFPTCRGRVGNFLTTVWLAWCCVVLGGCGTLPTAVTAMTDFCTPAPDPTHRYFGRPKSANLVIFVHGFCGDAKTTWTNEETGFDFPKELARELNDTYVFSFDYARGLERAPSISSVADHLEFEINLLLKQHPYRSIRFVAHSMGGIVSREYILRHNDMSKQPHITHLVLLASPSNGSELAGFGMLVPQNRQIEAMRHVDKGNLYLGSLNDRWSRAFKDSGHPYFILVSAGYEEMPLTIVGKPVRFSSAIANADVRLGFQKNHNEMASPKGAFDVLYRWTKNALTESLHARIDKEHQSYQNLYKQRQHRVLP